MQEVFAKIFGVANFERDYENVWEWITGNSAWLGANINIRREHDFNTGCYDAPLQIGIDSEVKISDSKKDEIGAKICDELKTTVYLGSIVYGKGNDYECMVSKKYEK